MSFTKRVNFLSWVSILNISLLSLWSNLLNYGINLPHPPILSLELLKHSLPARRSPVASLAATELSNDVKIGATQLRFERLS